MRRNQDCRSAGCGAGVVVGSTAGGTATGAAVLDSVEDDSDSESEREDSLSELELPPEPRGERMLRIQVWKQSL